VFNSSVLDIAIGLVFVYLLLGLICTAVNEWLAQKYQLRASTLRDGIAGLLQIPHGNAALIDEFYNHPMIKALSRPGSHPAYVPPKIFALVLMDILSPARATPEPPAERLSKIRSIIESLPDGDAKRSLVILASRSGNSIDSFETQLADWYDSSMDRVSGWYKGKVQIWTALIAACLTMFVNADSIDIARRLMIYPVLRDQIVQEAGKIGNAGGIPPAVTESQKADLSALTGWSTDFRTFHRIEACGQPKLRGSMSESDCRSQSIDDVKANRALARIWGDDSFPGADLLRQIPSGILFLWLWLIVPGHIAGWTVTAIAASLGAPFWFDTLNRFMNIRSAGVSPDEKGADKAAADTAAADKAKS
jgi:hypothetical protein